ncbi:formate dehydrogenase accessory sulfurtransferase FdhD [Alicyclobacillus sp. ALC3]|uniref:formate dehydrogenase accessory sulfurtransferase FdhD n=1 Tax=Alicyclobacillus sp. ALC3 TaxID=2796143 RepID=UPI0023788B5D|nr:formate dehydrogenase accessory sulfurtransferase FdhD [Alicyclobacillus sp. ALC3]WDL97849.1 formate dehydrogenase accessory sulfurtransferase FdhD [Alicyclobacillus sp. ALC3]
MARDRAELGLERASRQGEDGLPITAGVEVVRYGRAEFQPDIDEVASEYALTVFVNDRELATVVCTPEYMEDLAIGFLASEGVIRSIDQVESVQLSRLRGTVRVRTTSNINFNQDFYNKRYIASCCGKMRQTFYFTNDAQTAKHVDDPVTVTSDDIFRVMRDLDDAATVFHETGGVHIAALVDPRKDEEMLVRTDIGRHNALDKLFGRALRERMPLTGRVVTFSGRLSSEVLLKVAKIGVGIVLAKSAPTALAIDMANDLGITAVGFVRDDSFNVYSHAWRVAGARQVESES